MGTIHFGQRTDKADKTGLAPIRIVYQVKGQRRYFPTSLKCVPANWDTRKQQAIYCDKRTAKTIQPVLDYKIFLAESEVKEFNMKIESYRKEIEDIERRFGFDKITYTPQMVMEALANIRQPDAKRDDPGISVSAFITEFVKDSAGSHKPGTLKVYSGLAAHIVAFEKYKGKKVTFESLDKPLLKAFHSYLSQNKTVSKGEKIITIEGMNNVTSAKQMSTLKTLLNYARTDYKIDVNPDYRDYRVSRKDSDFEVITLTNDEFLKLYYFDLTDNKKLSHVRDVFCFSCATGLRYSDLAQLKPEHIRNHAIKMTSAKTGQQLEIPLSPYSVSILEKYKDQHRPLPIISNQKTNDYLKELCQKAEIDTPIEIIRKYGVKSISTVHKKYELISIHTGRKTFTTLSLEKGIAAQDVMAITGHTTYKAFKRYVDVTSSRRKVVMAQAWGEVPNNLKAV